MELAVQEPSAIAGGFGCLVAALIGLAHAGPASPSALRVQAPPVGVGDMIAFDGSRSFGGLNRKRLLVHRPDQFACVLDLGVLASEPGSFIVEEAAPRQVRAIRLHWCGPRTSDDAADCGRSPDLILDEAELRLLARLQQD
jgi:hypothetical protein